jgi:uncharacterized protein
MIQNTFVFLDKIGAGKERKLWEQGITDWSDFLRADIVKGVSAGRKAHYDRRLCEAQQALIADNASFFTCFPRTAQWRLYEHFRDDIGYVDIETDSRGEITIVGISNYYNTKVFVAGANLDAALVQKVIEQFKVLVTFNGGAFDLPKLRKQLGMKFAGPHIDLKPLCVKLGLVGGLKIVEELLGLQRPANLRGNPVDLWKAFHASGDHEYLELLVDYNKEDIENLKFIMDHCYKEMEKRVKEIKG